jgi:hypothetical protein
MVEKDKVLPTPVAYYLQRQLNQSQIMSKHSFTDLPHPQINSQDPFSEKRMRSPDGELANENFFGKLRIQRFHFRWGTLSQVLSLSMVSPAWH